MSGCCGGLQRKDQDTPTTHGNSQCGWSGTQIQFSTWVNQPPPRVVLLDTQGLYLNQHGKHLYSVYAMLGHSAEPFCQGIILKSTVVCQLLSSVHGHIKNFVPSSSCLRVTWWRAHSADLHSTGSLYCLPCYLDQWSQWVEDYIPNTLWSVGIPSHTLLVDTYICSLWGWDWRLSTAWHWGFSCLLPCSYTHLLDRWVGAWRPCQKSTTATTSIWAHLEGPKVPIQSLVSQLSWICHWLGWSHHWVRLHIHNPTLAVSRDSSGCASPPQSHQLLTVIHSDICKGDNMHITLALDERLMEVRMDSGCLTWISISHKYLHQLTNSPAFLQWQPIIPQTDASGLALTGILNQYDGYGILWSVNFYNHTYSPANQN